MLSRRNVRVKVMQVLYALNRDEGSTEVQAGINLYQQLVDHSFELYLFNLLYLLRTAEYARQDEVRRKAKLLPSEQDLTFEARLAKNPAVQSLAKNTTLTSKFAKLQLRHKVDADQVRKFYVEFSRTEIYQQYSSEATNGEADRQILLAMYKFLSNNELFEEIQQDHYPLWNDDKSLVVGAMKKTIKALPVEDAFYTDFEPPDETVKHFGEHLLRYVLEADAQLLGVIEPVLNNWDAERVAIIDMILLKMALGELIQFPTIPTKVTLNEYVDISKNYSTDRSKDFINGILDRLMRQLQDDGMIRKEGRGLIDE